MAGGICEGTGEYSAQETVFSRISLDSSIADLNLDNFQDAEFYYGEKLTSRNFGLPSKPKEKGKRTPK